MELRAGRRNDGVNGLMTKLLVAGGALSLLLGGCGGAFSEGEKPQVQIYVDGVQETTVELPFIDPAALHSGQSFAPTTYSIELKNIGSAAAEITEIGFEPTNDDGTDKNPYVELWFGNAFDLNNLPLELRNGGEFSFQVRFAPECPELPCPVGDPATLVIKTNDPEKAETRIVFSPPACNVNTQIEPTQDTFFNASPAMPETKTFDIRNTGNCNDTVVSCGFTGPTSKFTLQRVGNWPNNELLRPDDEPLQFTVTYTPAGDSSDDQAQVECYFQSRENTPIIVTLTTKQETGSFDVTYADQDKGFLDFTTVSEGCEQKVVNLYNEGPAVLKVKSVTIPDDAATAHYSVECAFPAASAGALPTPVPSYPVALGPGKSLDCTMEYCAATLAGHNATLRFSYDNPSAGTLEIPAFGGQPKSCFDYAPGSAAPPPGGPLQLQFLGAKDEPVEGNFVIYNCGNAPLTVTGLRLEDAFSPGQPSEYWTFVDAPEGEFDIGVSELQVLTLEMLVSDGATDTNGTLEIDYLDPAGAEVTFTAVSLKGYINPDSTAPTANIELAAGSETKVGSILQVSGLGSTQGSNRVAESGYVWYLVGKPEGSQVILNGPPAGPIAEIIPDVAGTYTFALRVHEGAGDYLYSEEARLEVEVTE